MRPAVFLDRDGTVNEEVGYVNHIDRFRLLPCAGPAIHRLNAAGIPAVLITNQSGVARGYFPEALVQEIHHRLQEELRQFGARLDAIYYCPHHPQGKLVPFARTCECRKPAPGMLLRAASERNLDLQSSFVVSDRYQDVAMGMAAGTCGVLVLSGYGQGELYYHKDNWSRQPDHVAQDLLAAVDWILLRLGK